MDKVVINSSFKNQLKIIFTSLFIIAISFGLNNNSFSKVAEPNKVVDSYYQTVYVPAYSSVFHGDNRFVYELTVTLSIRNTNLKTPITVTSADYYETSGKLIKKFVPLKRTIKPLQTLNFVIKESDKEGGSGASFIVKWQSAKKVNSPLIETVMIGTSGQQGISFTSRGIIIDANY